MKFDFQALFHFGMFMFLPNEMLKYKISSFAHSISIISICMPQYHESGTFEQMKSPIYSLFRNPNQSTPWPFQKRVFVPEKAYQLEIQSNSCCVHVIGGYTKQFPCNQNIFAHKNCCIIFKPFNQNVKYSYPLSVCKTVIFSGWQPCFSIVFFCCRSSWICCCMD